jgi:hypothetical protein
MIQLIDKFLLNMQDIELQILNDVQAIQLMVQLMLMSNKTTEKKMKFKNQKFNVQILIEVCLGF